MKTEQEIKQMVNTCNQYRSCAACPYNPEDISRFIGDRWKGGCPNYDRKLVYAMGKGYGDIKQAQIDVLNELKKKTHNYYPSIDSYCISQHIVLVRDIDELIKEVQNDNSKSN